MSVFHPPGGYPRLIRLVENSELPSNDCAATLDTQFNLLRIDKEIWEVMNSYQKHMIVRTHNTVTSVREALRK